MVCTLYGMRNLKYYVKCVNRISQFDIKKKNKIELNSDQAGFSDQVGYATSKYD
jgi:hypothetical protein